MAQRHGQVCLGLTVRAEPRACFARRARAVARRRSLRAAAWWPAVRAVRDPHLGRATPRRRGRAGRGCAAVATRPRSSAGRAHAGRRRRHPRGRGFRSRADRRAPRTFLPPPLSSNTARRVKNDRPQLAEIAGQPCSLRRPSPERRRVRRPERRARRSRAPRDEEGLHSWRREDLPCAGARLRRAIPRRPARAPEAECARRPAAAARRSTRATGWSARIPSSRQVRTSSAWVRCARRPRNLPGRGARRRPVKILDDDDGRRFGERSFR